MWATETWFLLWETCRWHGQLTSPLRGIELSSSGSSAVTNSLAVPTYPGQAYLLCWWDWRAREAWWYSCEYLVLVPHLSPVRLFALLVSERITTPSGSSNSQNSTETQEVLDTVSSSYKALKEVTTVKPRSTILHIYFARFNSVLSNIPGTQCVRISI